MQCWMLSEQSEAGARGTAATVQPDHTGNTQMFALLRMQKSLNTTLFQSFVGNLEAIETLVADHSLQALTLSSHAGRTGPEHWPPPPEPCLGTGVEVILLNLPSPGTSLTDTNNTNASLCKTTHIYILLWIQEVTTSYYEIYQGRSTWLIWGFFHLESD